MLPCISFNFIFIKILLKDTNRKVNSHASDVAKVKENLKEIEKLAYNASSEVEQISQYLRRDCLEITGIATNAECSAEAIIKSIGDVIGVPLQDNDISIAHPIKSAKITMTEKLYVLFDLDLLLIVVFRRFK